MLATFVDKEMQAFGILLKSKSPDRLSSNSVLLNTNSLPYMSLYNTSLSLRKTGVLILLLVSNISD